MREIFAGGFELSGRMEMICAEVHFLLYPHIGQARSGPVGKLSLCLKG